MPKLEEHLIRPEISVVNLQRMKVDMSIDSTKLGSKTVDRPGVLAESWQINAFKRTVQYIQAQGADIDKADEEYGTRLLNLLLSKSEWRILFGSFLKKAGNEIFLDITTSDSDLLTYPWEACAHADWKALGYNDTPPHEVVVVRSPAPYQDKWPAKEPIQILVAGVSAYGMATPNFDKEYRKIEESLQKAELIDGLNYQLKPLRETTYETLQKAVRNFQPHILHIVTHGKYGKHYLETSDGYPIPIQSGKLAEAVSVGSDNLCLLVSTACLGMADSQDGNTWNLGKLMASTIPLTIGMQLVITEKAALAFTSAFYSHLGVPNPVIDAFVKARERIREVHPGSPEWIAPVLYRGTAINANFFTPNVILSLLQNYSNNLSRAIDGLRRDKENVELWKQVDQILIDLDAQLFDGYDLKKIKIPSEQISQFTQVRKLADDLAGKLITLKRYLKLSENDRDLAIALTNLDFTHQVGPQIQSIYDLAKQLRKALIDWLASL